MDRITLFILMLLVYLVAMAYAFLPTRVPARVKARIKRGRAQPAAHPAVPEPLSLRRFASSLVTLLLGGACIVGGIALVSRGAAGLPDWAARLIGPSDGVVPGLLLLAAGLLLVLLTRYKIVRLPEGIAPTGQNPPRAAGHRSDMGTTRRP